MSEDFRKFMPVYIGSYLKNTPHLTAEEHGAYLLILMSYWTLGPPVADDAVMARLGRVPPDRWAAIRDTILAFFELRRGRWHNVRADAEMARAKAQVARAATAGRASGSARSAKKLQENCTEIAKKSEANSPAVSVASEFPLASSWPPSRTPSPSDKKEEESKRGDPSGSPGAESNVVPIKPPRPIKTIIFTDALVWVHRHYPKKTETGIRSWLGRLVRDYGEDWTISALRRAQQQAAIDPIPFVEGVLKGFKIRGVPGPRPDHASSSSIAGDVGLKSKEGT